MHRNPPCANSLLAASAFVAAAPHRIAPGAHRQVSPAASSAPAHSFLPGIPFTSWQVSGPGGLPKQGQLQPETTLWQPPAEVPPAVKGGNKPYPVGQVSGLASSGDGSVWVFHRGARTWNADGSVSDADGGATSNTLSGPAVLQVGGATQGLLALVGMPGA